MGTGRTYTHPDVFTSGVADGWAEPETDPARIDWPARQAAAAIPFEVVDGRPVNPCERTSVRHGRNEMGFWGETLMADALVTVTLPPFGVRYLLMVERDDGYGWAVPGGHVEPGETGPHAAVRELAEETGLDLFGGEPFLTLRAFLALDPRYVPDPRASDEAWAVTIPVHIDLGSRGALPEVTGGDDARRAEWVPADSYGYLADGLEDRYGGSVFAAHVDMLRQFLPAARATGQGSEDATAKLDAVRGVLSAFNWEHDDHQYALEQIERLVTSGDGA
ncbi:MAG TPA: NUDIX domain-containing protein [Streptosporangiaceae bacterium]|jgi:ADP-ribose pyrophosphatase YjhB (NUDIX family)